jgi:hypothetical protein
MLAHDYDGMRGLRHIDRDAKKVHLALKLACRFIGKRNGAYGEIYPPNRRANTVSQL